MMRILVVDDERGAAEALARLLRLDGFEALSFTSPLVARDAIEGGGFDAVVTDLEMPRLHGVEVIRCARKSCPRAPIFVVSAYSDSAVASSALHAGALRVFGKPLDYDALLAALQGVLQTARP